MLAVVTPDVVLLSTARLLIWMVLLYFAVRHRAWLSILVVALVAAGTVLLALGWPVVQQLLAFGTSGLIVYLLVDRLGRKSSHLGKMLAAKEADWSRERHDLRNDLAAWETRALLAEARLEERPE